MPCLLRFALIERWRSISREHLTTKVAPFRAIINVENKDLMHKIINNTLKRKQKGKMLT